MTSSDVTSSDNVTSPEVEMVVPDREYQICNLQPCPAQPGAITDFRTQQCIQYNDVPYQVSFDKQTVVTAVNSNCSSYNTCHPTYTDKKVRRL